MKIFLVILYVFLISCASHNNPCGRLWLQEVRRVTENYTSEYTGLDTLIRIDGYYYRVDSTGAVNGASFKVSNEGNFHILYIRYNDHTKIQEGFRNDRILRSARGIGGYTLSGDTIKARWARRFQPGGYDIFLQQYVIENDTTLQLIWQLFEPCMSDGREHNPVRNETFRFFQYDFNTR